jgi:hypothetical protein
VTNNLLNGRSLRLAEKTRPKWAFHERVRKIGSPVLLA